MKLDLDRTPTGQSDLPVDGRLILDLGADGPSEVRIAGSLRVDNLESRCVVRGAVEVAGKAICGRCLKEFELTFDVPVEFMVLRGRGQEDEDAASLVLHQRDGVLDLAETLREAAVLAMPQTRVCSQECRGLCVHCGADLNEGDCDCEDDDVDPRWDGLPD